MKLQVYKFCVDFSSFKKSLIIVAVASIVVLLYSIYWFSVVSSIKAAVVNWVSARAEQGIAVSYESFLINGFPLDFEIIVVKPQIQKLNFNTHGDNILDHKKWKWQSMYATATTRTWNLSKFEANLSGKNTLVFEGKDNSNSFSAESEKITMRAENFESGWPKKLELDITGLEILGSQGNGIASIKSLLVTSDALLSGDELNTLGGIASTYAFKVKSHDIHFPKFIKLPLGQDITEISGDLRVVGHLEPSVNSGSLSRWRDSGGIIEVRSFKTTYGSLMADAVGTVALDQALQPLVAMSANFKGFFSTIDQLKNAGFIRPSDGSLAKMVLGVFAKRVSSGQRIISLPLTVQGGELSVGPVALIKVPPINW